MEYKKNSKHKLTITDVGIDGEGIGKLDGFTVFVKDAVPGDEIITTLTKVKKNYGYGICSEIITQSLHRVMPECEISRPCGGCQLQVMDYAYQLQIKENKVRNNLQRIGGFSEELLREIMEPIAGMDVPFYYRNKAQYPVGKGKDGRLVTGFYAARTHSIISATGCKIGAKTDAEILKTILAWMEEQKISAYDETTGKGVLRHILIRTGFTTGQIMVCLVINAREIAAKKTDVLVSRLQALNWEDKTMDGKDFYIETVVTSINTQNTNVIMGKEIQVLFGNGYITDYIGDVAFQISPLSFFQVNPVQTRVLYETALSYAGLTGSESVWDLYCGIGTISLFLAQKAGMVYGVEIVPEAIEDAKKNAQLNHMENTRFFVGKAEEVLPQFYEKESKLAEANDANKKMLTPDVIVVDPPRKGCDEACLTTMLKMAPERIVYVSCDSATLARDLKILCEKDYRLERVRACDMFPMTGHVESVVLITRKDK